MKKLLFIFLMTLFVQDGHSQPAWDSLGAGLSSVNGVNRIWHIGGRIFSSGANLSTTPLYEYTPSGWIPVITSIAVGMVTDITFDSIFNKVVIVGKYGDLIGPVNAAISNGIAIWDWTTDSILPLGIGVNFPAEYTYKAKIYDSKLFVIGRFKILAADTIHNIMKVDLQTGTYSKVCKVDSNCLIRDILFFNGDTIVAGSFVWQGEEYPLARVTTSGLDYSISGPFRGFALSMTYWNNEIVFAGNMADTVINIHPIGIYDGMSHRKLAKTNGPVNSVAVFNTELYVGGTFSVITDSSGISSSVNNLAKWNGTWDDVMGGCTDVILPIVRYLFPSHDTLYVSGKFTQAGTVSALNVARLITPSTNVIGENLMNEQQLFLYPNPTFGQFTLSSSADNSEISDSIEIFDFTGKKVAEYCSKLPIDIDIDLQQGIYVLKVNTHVIRFLVL